MKETEWWKNNKNCSILDFGCGTGLFLLNFVDTSSFIFAGDTSKKMIEILNSKLEKLDRNTRSKVVTQVLKNEDGLDIKH